MAAFYVVLASDHSCHGGDRKFTSSRFDRSDIAVHSEPDRAVHDQHSMGFRGDLFEQPEPLAANSMFVKGKAGDVPTWPSEALHEANADRVRNYRRYNRDTLRLSKHRSHGWAWRDLNHVWT
jgi:hypothetical protein